MVLWHMVILISIVFISAPPVSRADNQAQQFCQQFIDWPSAERSKWTKDVDKTTYSNIKANEDLHFSDAQNSVTLKCLQETRGLYIQRVFQACQAGMDSFAPFQAIISERVKACLGRAMTGKIDSKWDTRRGE